MDTIVEGETFFLPGDEYLYFGVCLLHKFKHEEVARENVQELFPNALLENHSQQREQYVK
jgi:hypothetical protein